MKHLSWDEVWAYAEGEYVQDLSRVEEHLRHCTQCHSRLQSVQKANSAIIQAFSSRVATPVVTQSEAFRNTLHAKWTSQSTKHVVRKNRWKAWMAGAAGVSAAACIAGMLVVQTNARGQHPGLAPGGTNQVWSVGGREGQTQGSPQKQSSNPNATDQSGSDTAMPHTIDVKLPVNVSTPGGQPISNAHVAVLGNGRILASGVTGPDGNTPSLSIAAPVDPVLAQTFGQSIPARGTVTVVAWKSGFQSSVNVNTWVLPESTSLRVTTNQLLTPEKSILVNDDGFHVMEVDNYVKWVQQRIQDPVTSHKFAGTPHTQVTAHVFDESGRPVENATVAVVVGGDVQGIATTSAEGTISSIDAPTEADMRVSYPGATHVPRVIHVVVFKQGYTPFVALQYPANPGATTSLSKVMLSSTASQQAQGVNQVGTPQAFPILPDSNDARALVAWLQHQR